MKLYPYASTLQKVKDKEDKHNTRLSLSINTSKTAISLNAEQAYKWQKVEQDNCNHSHFMAYGRNINKIMNVNWLPVAYNKNSFQICLIKRESPRLNRIN